MLEFVCDVEGCEARAAVDDPPTSLPPGWVSVTTSDEPTDPASSLPPMLSQVVHASMAMVGGVSEFRSSQRHLLCHKHAQALPRFKSAGPPRGLSAKEQAEILAEYEEKFAQGETP